MPYFPKRSKKNVEENNISFNTNLDSDAVDHDKINEFKKVLDSHHNIENAKKELYQNNTPKEVKSNLKDFDKKAVLQKNVFVKKNNFYFSLKKVFDDFSFGLANIQFLNIILFLLIPSYYIIGLILSFKVLLKNFFENNYEYFFKNFDSEKNKVYIYGNILGFSLIFLGISATFKVKWLYIFTFIIIGIFSSLYIKGSNKLLQLSIPKDKRSHFLKFISYYGLLFTSFTMIVAGLILDSSNSIVLSNNIVVPIYTLMFFFSGILFIISSYMITQIKQLKFVEEKNNNYNSFFKIIKNIFVKNLEYYDEFKNNTKNNSFLRRMLLAGILFYSIQLSLNYILGLYFFELYNSFFLVSLLLASTIISSFLIPLFFDSKTLRSKGKSLILVLGTSLALILPLILFLFNSNFFINFFKQNFSINYELFFNGLTLLYFIVAISGSSIAGVAFSRLNFDVLRIDERKKFMSILGFGINIFSAFFISIVFFLKELFSFSFSFFFITLVYFFVLILFGKSLNANEEKKYEESLLKK